MGVWRFEKKDGEWTPTIMSEKCAGWKGEGYSLPVSVTSDEDYTVNIQYVPATGPGYAGFFNIISVENADANIFKITRDDDSCFPFDAIATTPSGKKRCEDLVLGELVLVDHKGTFEPIYFFGHRENYETLFVELTLANGKKTSATPQHYIFTFNNRNKKMVHIKDVVKGDFVKYNGKRIKVADTNFVHKKGFISPHTKSHEIVIDGVQASCYAVEKFIIVNNVAVNIADSLGITIPQFIIDPIREIGSNTINKFNL